MPDTGTLGTATRRSRPPVTTAIGLGPVGGDRWDLLRAATRLSTGPLQISPTGKIDGRDRPGRKNPTNPDRTVFQRTNIAAVTNPQSTPTSMWLVFNRPSLAGFDRPLTIYASTGNIALPLCQTIPGATSSHGI